MSAIIVAVAGAAVAVWSAYQSHEALQLSRQQAALAAFRPLQFLTTQECRLAIAPLPEGVLFESLVVIAGQGVWRSQEINQTTETIDLMPLADVAFNSVDERFLARIAAEGAPPRPLPDREPPQEGWSEWTTTDNYFTEYDVLVPVLASYAIEIQGQWQEYYSRMGLRVRYSPTISWVEGEPAPKVMPQAKTCHGFITMERYDSAEDARVLSAGDWQNFVTLLRSSSGLVSTTRN